jgi:TetR/AcrR family transcriptional regulator, tetracycline repressor protein
VKLTVDRIVDAGMVVFGEHGYAGMSMRQVADRLDVHAGSLYYHVRNKEALLRLLAGRVAGAAYAAGSFALDELPDDASWSERVEVQLVALRAKLLEHDGGPVLLASSPAMLTPEALSIMERLLATLDAGGVPAADRPVAADMLLSYVTGFVLQEQAEPGVPAAAVDPGEMVERFPLTMRDGPAYGPEEMFRRSLRLQLAAIEGLISR